MIRSAKSLQEAISAGQTVARMTELGGGTHFHWVTTDTNEPVHGQALKALIKRGDVQIISTDICGDPMQYGATQ